MRIECEQVDVGFLTACEMDRAPGWGARKIRERLIRRFPGIKIPASVNGFTAAPFVHAVRVASQFSHINLDR
jgi:hypothetical protein